MATKKFWLELVLRLIIGAVFIYASIPKIMDPGGFARIVYGYYLFPDYSINLIAIVVPFIELLAGTALIIGLFKDSALVIVNGLYLCFIVLISINLARGHQFDCGCFSVGNPDQVSSAVWLLVRDVGFLICGLYLWFVMKTNRAHSLKYRRM